MTTASIRELAVDPLVYAPLYHQTDPNYPDIARVHLDTEDGAVWADICSQDQQTMMTADQAAGRELVFGISPYLTADELNHAMRGATELFERMMGDDADVAAADALDAYFAAFEPADDVYAYMALEYIGEWGADEVRAAISADGSLEALAERLQREAVAAKIAISGDMQDALATILAEADADAEFAS